MSWDPAAVVGAIQDVWESVTGVRYAPDYPPEQINMSSVDGGLQIVTYPSNGAASLASLTGTGTIPGCYQVRPDVYVSLLYYPLKNLPREVEALLPILQAGVVALLESMDLAGTVAVIQAVRWNFVAAEWGGMPMRGYRVEIEVEHLAEAFT